MAVLNCKSFVLKTDGSPEGTTVLINGNKVLNVKSVSVDYDVANEKFNIVLGQLDGKNLELTSLQFIGG